MKISKFRTFSPKKRLLYKSFHNLRPKRRTKALQPFQNRSVKTELCAAAFIHRDCLFLQDFSNLYNSIFFPKKVGPLMMCHIHETSNWGVPIALKLSDCKLLLPFGGEDDHFGSQFGVYDFFLSFLTRIFLIWIIQNFYVCKIPTGFV